MEEFQAYLRLLVEERKRLSTVVSREHRPLTPAEIKELARLTGAIAALANTINELSPPPALPPSGAPAAGANPDFRLVASQVFQTQRESYRFTSQLMAEYGRWLVTTIAAVQAGGLFLISSIDRSDLTLAQKGPGIWALTVGLVLIFAAGLAAWSNWGTHAEWYARWTNATILVDPSEWPKEDPKLNRWMDFTNKASLVLGVASVLCMPIAVALVLLQSVAG